MRLFDASSSKSLVQRYRAVASAGVGRPAKLIVAVWAVVLTGTMTLLVTGGWYVSCQDSQGNHLGGIDCFQYRTLPSTGAEPAATIGFVPLVIVASVALMMVVVIPVSAAVRSRRESIEY
jgi:hypothetical protein